ncbi:unnamed protein product [Rotaria socialis]|uniref:VCBS repeat-containing protein n=1 Tax=Rotaria socialis TaxID=392032 RepID=A0A818DJV3_9BILA|nr:unnamed protein product [Rotaria socialis]CAF3618278.1 unnamed protein product [Rotaria socialis]CAF4283716.1 unnamed protein product [Rotaria socialis]CAF4565188.1 unnamed protein product [Rotaria socialis]
MLEYYSIHGSFSFTRQTLYSTGSDPISMSAGHFNNDNQLDIVVTSYFENSLDIIFGYENGSFTKTTTYITDSPSYSVTVNDINNDVRPDAVTIKFDDASLIVFIGSSDGSFEKQML